MYHIAHRTQFYSKVRVTMAEDNKLNIRLHIYDTDMAVKINRSDEENVS